MPSLSRLILALALACGALENTPVWSQTIFAYERHFDRRHGLTGANISGVATDRDGFIWIATVDGLCRFDGTQTTVFRHQPDDTSSISSNNLTDLFYDSTRHVLWITTRTQGLNRLDIQTGRSRRFTHFRRGVETGAVDNLNWVVQDRRGHIWTGSESGLLELRPGETVFRPHAYAPTPDTGDAAGLNLILNMETGIFDVQNDSVLWIGTSAGLLQYNIRSERFRRFVPGPGTSADPGASRIRCLYQHANGNLYYGTWHAGGYLFDHRSETIRPLTLEGVVPDPVAWVNVSAFYPKSDRAVWVTTLGGLAELDVQTSRMTVVRANDIQREHRYGVRYVDRYGRYWHWFQDKLVLFNPLVNQFRHYACPDQLSKQPFSVMKILVDPSGGVLYLAAIYAEGVYALDLRSGNWQLLRDPRGKPLPVHFRDLIRTRQGALLAVSDNTIFEIVANPGFLKPYPYQPSARGGMLRSLLEDAQGNLWIGTFYDGLIRWNPQSRTERIYRAELEDTLTPGSALRNLSLMEDRFHRIWIRHAKGYSVYDPQRDTFFRFYPFGLEAKAFVSCFATDPAGRIWVYGHEQPLGVADPEHFRSGVQWPPALQQRGALTKSYELLFDQRGRLWLAAANELERWDMAGKTSRIIPGKYGIHGPINTLALLPSGEIALGHGRSVSVFHPDRLVRNPEIPRPYLTAFKVFQQDLKLGKELAYVRDIYLKHWQNYISIEFSAIGFSLPEEQRFEYQLTGIDPGWVDPGERRYVSYTNLNSGDYVFHLRVFNNEGLGMELPLRVHIHIATPWWRTWWAVLLYLAALAFGLFRLYRFQLNRKLAEAENRRLRELDAVKTRLYTNITHEFRTPLTVISGMAGQIKAQPERWLAEGPDIIRRNSESLLRLVNHMLELRKLEAGMLPVRLEQGDIVAYVKYLLESFHSYAASKNIELSVKCQWEHFQMDYDREKILTIVSNLLSNAVKFTPAGGAVGLRLDAPPAAAPEAPSYIELSVRDTGIGIPPEALPLIFDRFHQVDAAYEETGGGGSGIGLALARELTQLLGGNIRVDSVYGQGTVFTVTLPVTRQAPPAPPWPVAAEQMLTFPEPVASEKPARESGQRRPLIQLVEDNADVVRYLRACLEPAYRLIAAPDGRSGLEQAFAEIPDLIVSDVMMPGMDGFELCRHLKTDERTDHIPVILLTARADMESRLQGLQRGADAYLAKPFNQAELLLQIRNLLDNRRTLQAHFRALAAQPAPAAGPELEENAFVLKLRALVEAHLDDSHFDVDRLCRELGMSKSNLHRKLTALTGRSANQFIRHIRLAKASALLRNPERTIAAVAFDCGFNDPVYFARVFRQEFGAAPSEWRHKQ
ncbi:MAG: response regulator [Saprospirales bacterium]|nr:response regulator [Saprospirales bacterium]